VNGNPLHFSDPLGLDIYRGPGRNYSDAAPGAGCERAIVAGDYIVDWVPCADPPRPPSAGHAAAEASGGSCPIDEPAPFDWQTELLAAARDALRPDPTWLIPELKAGKVLAAMLSVKKASKVAKSTRIEQIGSFTKKTEVRPGVGPGQSRAEYIIYKNERGETIRVQKDSYDRAGFFQHRKDK
jgi:hypothetical protein